MIVTSFGEKGFEQYGSRFIETFLKYWPEDETLVIYYEAELKINSPRVECRNLFDVYGMAEFLDNINESHEIYKGLRTIKGQKFYDYKFDAFKFARKVFSIADAALNHEGIVTWIDADVYTHSPVPENFCKDLLNGCYVSHLYRDWSYSECGFMSFDTTRVENVGFMNIYRNYYITGAFRYLGEWHDCYVFDTTRELTGIDSVDLAAGIKDDHPFVKSVLGKYMDHCKGNRKKEGFSPELFNAKQG